MSIETVSLISFVLMTVLSPGPNNISSASIGSALGLQADPEIPGRDCCQILFCHAAVCLGVQHIAEVHPDHGAGALYHRGVIHLVACGGDSSGEL